MEQGSTRPCGCSPLGEEQGSRRARETDTHPSMARRSAIDWILPVEKICSMLVVLL